MANMDLKRALEASQRLEGSLFHSIAPICLEDFVEKLVLILWM